MRVHRGSLFWGIFFVLLGAIPLADRAGLIDVAQLVDVGRLWPLAIIAVGLVILLSRTQLAILGTVVSALILGGLAGVAIAAGGSFVFNFGDCNPTNTANLQHVTRTGTLDPSGTVELDFNCGTMNVSTGSGDGWNLDAGYRDQAPTIDASGGRLTVRSASNSREQAWTLVVPRDRVGAFDVQFNAGSGTLDVGGAKLAQLQVRANAGDLKVLAAGTSINGLDAEMNAGRLRLDLDGPTDGRVHVNAGSIDVCAPASADLRFTVSEQLTFGTNLSARGLSRNGDVWTRTGSGGPVIRLDVSGNAGSFNLDPTGGCK